MWFSSAQIKFLFASGIVQGTSLIIPRNILTVPQQEQPELFNRYFDSDTTCKFWRWVDATKHIQIVGNGKED